MRQLFVILVGVNDCGGYLRQEPMASFTITMIGKESEQSFTCEGDQYILDLAQLGRCKLTKALAIRAEI